MTNWVWVFTMNVTPWNATLVANILKEVAELKISWNIRYNIAINWNTICGYEEWESKEAQASSMKDPKVWALIEQTFPYMDRRPTMVFEGKSII